MALQKAKYRLFKAGPRSKSWQAELSFPDGSSETVEIEYEEKSRAAMSAGHLWAKKAREKGLAPTKIKTEAGVGPGDLISAAREGVRVPTTTNGEDRITARLEAIVGLVTAIENLDPADRAWLKTVAFSG
jgi:hypothetical protein